MFWESVRTVRKKITFCLYKFLKAVGAGLESVEEFFYIGTI